MSALRRLAGLFLMLIAALGVAGCAAGIFGAWQFRAYADPRVHTISARLEVGLERVAEAAQKVHLALDKAGADGAQCNKVPGKKEGDDPPRYMKLIARTVEKRVAPGINDLNGRLTTFADAGVALTSILKSLEDSPADLSGRLHPEKLELWGDQAAQITATLRRLQSVVGDGSKDAEQERVAATRDVEQALARCAETVEAWQADLDAARQDLPDLKIQILNWLTLGAIAVTVVCTWMGLGQVSLLIHGWKLLTRSSQST